MYYGQVYHWDDSGNKIIVVHVSEKSFNTPNEALDEASDWAEDNGIDVELG
jgi:hypothetical protein